MEIIGNRKISMKMIDWQKEELMEENFVEEADYGENVGDEEFTGLFDDRKTKLLIETYRKFQKEMNEGRMKKKVVWRKVCF